MLQCFTHAAGALWRLFGKMGPCDENVLQPVHEVQINQLGDDLAFFSSASNILLGDGLVLLSASLYAVSNVCQEYTVKNLSRVEFLGMVGLFGTTISTVQM